MSKNKKVQGISLPWRAEPQSDETINVYDADGFYLFFVSNAALNRDEAVEVVLEAVNRDPLFDEMMEALKVTTAMLNTDMGQVINKHHVKSMNNLIARAGGKEKVR